MKLEQQSNVTQKDSISKTIPQASALAIYSSRIAVQSQSKALGRVCDVTFRVIWQLRSHGSAGPLYNLKA
jgi:hypothetical protein